MRIIVVGNQKGGVGKTTISVHLAAYWAAEGKRVLLVDADPQGSAADWVGEDSSIDVTQHAAGPGIGTALGQIAPQYDVVVVDLPPGLTAEATEESIMAATQVIIPVQPSAVDIRASLPYVELARRHNKPVRLVLNRQGRTRRMRDEIRGALVVARAPVCKAEIGNRVAFADCVPAHETVFVSDARGKAAAEMAALGKEVWRHGKEA